MAKLPPGLSSKDFQAAIGQFEAAVGKSGCLPAMRMWRCIEIRTPSF